MKNRVSGISKRPVWEGRVTSSYSSAFYYVPKSNKINQTECSHLCHAGVQAENLSHTFGHPLGLCEGSVDMMRGFLIQQVLALKFPMFLQLGPFRDLPSVAVFAGPRSVWHTWEPEQSPALACGLSWSRLHPVLYSEPLWVRDLASRTWQSRDSLSVPKFPSRGSSFARKFAGASHLLLGRFLGLRH